MTRSLRKLSFTISLLALFSPKVPFADPLHDAAGDGDVAAVKRLLALGHAINARDENEATPLHWAAYGGHAEVVRLLIARGADVYANETQRWATALQQAPRQRPVERAEANTNGVTPLHWAAASGDTIVAQLLIAEGANVNAKSLDGMTPLAVARAMGHEEVADLLTRHGARN